MATNEYDECETTGGQHAWFFDGDAEEATCAACGAELVSVYYDY